MFGAPSLFPELKAYKMVYYSLYRSSLFSVFTSLFSPFSSTVPPDLEAQDHRNHTTLIVGNSVYGILHLCLSNVMFVFPAPLCLIVFSSLLPYSGSLPYLKRMPYRNRQPLHKLVYINIKGLNSPFKRTYPMHARDPHLQEVTS